MPFSFPKNEKLKSKKLIAQLFQEGSSLSKYPLRLIYIRTSETSPVKIQVAVTVPKKQFKKAVDRNHIKRILRESYRQNKPLLFNNIEGNFAFLFLYLGKEIPQYQEVESAMLAIFQKFLSKEGHAKVDQ